MDNTKIPCPYSDLELSIALLSAAEKVQNKMEAVNEVVDKLINKLEASSDTERAAKFHDIPVDTLVNSPNYCNLKKEYFQNLINRFIAKMVGLGLTEKEAWSIIMCNKLNFLK